MNILNALKQLRDDIKAWVTVNLNALNAKIDEKTIPIDSELSSTSTNPVQNQAIAKEINSINNRVGNTSVATQISNAIDKVPTFSGDYNDLTNAPDISEDGSGNMIIADESGNIIFKVDADGIHTTAISLNGEAAATEKYVDDAVANIDIPEVDFTGYATETYVNEAIANIDFPETDLTGYATETYVDNKVADLVNSAPEALNTLGELATALENHEDAYDALLETVGGKATQEDLNNLKEELSESIVAEADEWKVVDEAGNIIFSVDASGAHTTALTLNGESVEDIINDIATPDWNQNDETQPDYVKNRTHYARDIDFTYNGPYDFVKVDGIAPDSRLVSIATLGTLNSNVEPTNYSMIGLFGNNYTGVKFGEIVKNTPNGPSLYFCIIATYIGTGYALRLYTSSESGLYGATPTITDVKHVTKLSAMYLPDDVLSAASAIPSVNSSNNGQFLRVVDGVWTAATVPNAEEASF